MSNPTAKQPKIKKCQSSHVFEGFEKFIERHLVKGHDIRMFIDRKGNSYAIFCAACNPTMGDVMEPRN
jgi:hypothetical protein